MVPRVRPVPPGRWRRVASAGALAAIAMLAAGAHWRAEGTERGTEPLVAELRQALGTVDATGPRLSIDPADRAPRRRGAWLPARWAARARAADDRRTAALAVAARVARAARSGADPEAVHAAALVDLRWGSPSARAVDSAIARLETIESLVERRAPLLSDLAAAYALRFARAPEARALLKSIEAAERALDLDAASLPARYNLVLALDRLGLLDQAAREARAYLARDSTSAWARAVRDVARRDAGPPAAAAPTAAASAAALAAFARRDHERARQAGWDEGLARWSALAGSGDADGAERSLRFAEAIGRALEADGGDATLADAVRDIRARAASPAAYRAAVAAHARYAAAQREYRTGAYERAERAFARTLAGDGVSRALAGWAEVFRGSSSVHAGRRAAGERMLRAVAAGDSVRHPALVGRAYASLSTALLRDGRDADAARTLAAAERLLARAGERELLGAVQAMLIESAVFSGRDAEGYAAAWRALATLRGSPHTYWRHNALYLLAQEADADGLARAAARCHDEDVTAAAGVGRPFEHAEALLARARLRGGTRARTALAADVRRARDLVAAVPPGSARAWGRADLALSEAMALLPTRPADAARLLDSSIAFAETSGNVLRLVRALPIRAEARAAAGAVGPALADLERTVGLLDVRATRLGSTFERAAFYRQARRVLERIVLLRLASGQADAALADVDHARWLIAAAGRRGDPGRRALPAFRRATAVVYARAADTLVAWTVTDTVVRAVRTPIDGARLDQAIDRTRGALELRSPEDVVRPMLAELHELLVRPIAGRLGPAGRPLVVVADGALASVPFAALYDARRGRYLVEDHELRFASSLRDAAADGPGGGAAAAGAAAAAVIVADPAFDARGHPDLARLPGAADEAEAVRALYPRHVMLAGGDAARDAVAAALRGARVVHYAGHAVFDADRPERSYLVLAGPGGSGRLTATDIARLPLRKVRIVALSSCQTVGAQRDAVGGLAGLAGAFHAAGVGGVVGSTWRVDDALTRPLMVEFHRSYAASGRGPAALRAAQLRLLRSPSASLRAPATWAPFRYVGR